MLPFGPFLAPNVIVVDRTIGHFSAEAVQQ